MLDAMKGVVAVDGQSVTFSGHASRRASERAFSV